MARDPLLIESWQTEIPLTQRKQYETVNPKWDPLKSLTDSHDRIRHLTKNNNELVARLLKTEAKLDSAGLKIWILTAAVVVETGLIAWFADQLFSRLH